jgi:ribosomal protein S6--L-glutamate ligase
MQLIVLTRFHSQHVGAPLVARLVQAARIQGHELLMINPAEVVQEFSENPNPTTCPVMWRGQPFPTSDLVLPIARWDDQHTWHIAQTLIDWGHGALTHQRIPLGDHITMARLLARYNLPAPRSWVMAHPSQLSVIMNELYFPILMRSRFGGSGRRVAVVQHSGEAYTNAQYLAAGGQPFLVQELPEPYGEDVRVLLLGNKPLAAIHRQAPSGFMRPKEEGNPMVSVTELSAEEARIAAAAAQMYGAPFCAVSLLRSKLRGPLVMEVSRIPAITEMESATGRDLAGAIITHLAAYAATQKATPKKPSAPVTPFPKTVAAE